MCKSHSSTPGNCGASLDRIAQYQSHYTLNLLGPLQNGAQATLANKDGWSPLHIAARQGFSPLVALLLHHGPEMVHHRSKNGRLPIHTAGMSPLIIFWLVLTLSTALDSLFIFLIHLNHGSYCFVYISTAQHGHMEVVQLLLHHSPQSLLAQDKAGASVLMCACVGNHPAMVSHLLACKPTPSLATRDAAGLTPLDIATRLGFDSLCRVLLDAGSDPSNSERKQ